MCDLLRSTTLIGKGKKSVSLRGEGENPGTNSRVLNFQTGWVDLSDMFETSVTVGIFPYASRVSDVKQETARPQPCLVSDRE